MFACVCVCVCVCGCPPRNASAQPPPTCPRRQRISLAPTGLVGQLRINCTARTAPTVVPPPAASLPSTPSTNSDRLPEPQLPSFSSSSSSAALTAAVVAPAMHTNPAHNPDTPTNTNASIVNTRGENLDYTCPHCDRTFTSHIGLVGHLRIYHTEAGESVPEPPTSASTIQTALSYSCTEWVYSTTCASTKTGGRQPPAAPYHDILPHQHLTAHQHHPPHAPNCHLPRN
ncbi:hypothetical protein SprV_0401678300 [Sparganum proliferum]